MEAPRSPATPTKHKLCVVTFADPLEGHMVRISVPLETDHISGRDVRAAVLQRLQPVEGYEFVILVGSQGPPTPLSSPHLPPAELSNANKPLVPLRIEPGAASPPPPLSQPNPHGHSPPHHHHRHHPHHHHRLTPSHSGEEAGADVVGAENAELMEDEAVFECEASRRTLRVRLVVTLAKAKEDNINSDHNKDDDIIKFGSLGPEAAHSLISGDMDDETSRRLSQSLPAMTYMQFAMMHPYHAARFAPVQGDNPPQQELGVDELLDAITKNSLENDGDQDAVVSATDHCKSLMQALLESEDNMRRAVELDALKTISLCMKANMGSADFQIRACALIRLLCTSAMELAAGWSMSQQSSGSSVSESQLRVPELKVTAPSPIVSPHRGFLHMMVVANNNQASDQIRLAEEEEPQSLAHGNGGNRPINKRRTRGDHLQRLLRVNESLYACLVVLKTFPHDSRAVIAAAGALTSMLWQHGYIMQKHLTLLIAFGGVSTLMKAFHVAESDPNAVAAVTNVLQLVASDEDSWEDLKRWSEVVRLCVTRMQAYVSHVTMQRPVVWFLAYLCCHSGMERTMVEAGVVQAAAVVLRTHYAVSSLVHAVMQLFVNLTFYDGSAEAASRLLCSHTDLLLRCLAAHHADVHVQSMGCGLFRNMAIELKSDPAALMHFSAAPEAVGAAIAAFPENPKVVENAFSFLWTYSAMHAIPRREAVDLVFAALRHHPGHVAVHRQALGLLRTVLLDAEVIQGEFIAMNGLQALFLVMRNFRATPDILVHCLRLLFCLSKLDSNRVHLLQQGCLEAVLEVLQSHPPNADVQNWGLSVIWNVGTAGSVSDEGKQELMRLGTLPVIINAMRLHSQNFDIQQDGINILLNMSHGRYGISQMNQLDVGTIVRQAKVQHPRLKKEATHLLRNLEESDCKAM